MTVAEAPAAEGQPNSRLPGFALLGLAILVAIGVASYLALAGDDGSSPDEAVRSYYSALVNGPDAADRVLAPALREDPARGTIAFAHLSVEITPDDHPTVSGLATRVLSEQDGWAQVRATGTVTANGPALPFDELLYLQKSGNQWLVSNEGEFARAFSGQGTSTVKGLGMLAPQRPKEGELAPDFALLDARDGKSVVTLSSFRGKAVVLNWYASWCRPCKDEMPELDAAYKQANGDLVVLGLDWLESREKAQGVLEEYGATYPAVLDSEGAVHDHYRVAGTPTSYFIDKDGIVRSARTGPVEGEMLAERLAQIGITYVPAK